MYGGCTWTMNRDSEKLIRSTQRKMMRKIAGVHRKAGEETTTTLLHQSCTSSSCSDTTSSDSGSEEDIQTGESWVEWIQRSTHIAIAAQKKAGVKDWTAEYRRRLWRFAGHTARRTDQRWNTVLLDWVPERGRRFPWRPKMRWADPIKKYCLSYGISSHWWELARDRKKWSAAEDGFVSESL